VKAIVLIMHQAGVDDDEAYALLRRESMRSRQSLEDYCDALLKKTSGSPALITPQMTTRRLIDQA